MDWYTWNPKLYLADTLNFTLAEDGAYRRLIDYYMETRAPIPSNKVALCRILGIGQDEFDAIAEQVLSKFNEIDGELHHNTCNANLDKQDLLSKKRSDVAKSGHKKRHKNKGVKPIDEQLPDNSTHTGQDKTGEDSKKEGICQSGLAVDLFNELASKLGLAQVQKLTASRKTKLNARLKDCGGIDGWKHALDQVRASDFLSGKKSEWKADFDFLITPSKFVKVMEGSYANVKPTNQGGGGQGGEIKAALQRAADGLRERSE